MNGLLRRLTRRRAATADEPPPGTPAASEPVDATVVSHEEGPPLSEEDRAREEELRRRRRDLPAGLDADRLETPVGEGARTGAVRRRIRFLTAAREVLLRDLGGFSYEVHRAGGAAHGGHRDIVETKAGRIAAIDEELRALEARLGVTEPPGTVVRKPGIGGTCPTCGELHGSDAGWCWHCGTPLSDRARKRAEEATDRAIADRQAREREAAAARAAAVQPAPAEPAPADPAPDGTRAALQEYTGSTEEPGAVKAQPPAEGATPSPEAPTSDLGEPVATERRP
jgi:hypothetical protein